MDCPNHITNHEKGKHLTSCVSLDIKMKRISEQGNSFSARNGVQLSQNGICLFSDTLFILILSETQDL